MQSNQRPAPQAEGEGGDLLPRLSWVATAIIVYCLLSGLVVVVLPFDVYVQYSILVHSAVGLLATLPLLAVVYLHWRQRRAETAPRIAPLALAATALLVLCLASGLWVAGAGLFGVRVPGLASGAHWLSGLLVGGLAVLHVLPVLLRSAGRDASSGGVSRSWPLAACLAVLLPLFGATGLLSFATDEPQPFQAFADDYEWPYGDDRPFWPSRAAIAEPPWLEAFLGAARQELGAGLADGLAAAMRGPETAGPRARVAAWSESSGLDAQARAKLDALVDRAIRDKRGSGSLRPDALAGSAGCGSSGCHEAIYEEWRTSAHGFAAEDELFLRVQDLLIESKGLAASRACAGCHDPAALLGGLRSGSGAADARLEIFEGNSCITCHSTVETDTEGNGGYVIRPPRRYLFEGYEEGVGGLLGRFLIRTYPEHHVAQYERPLYKKSEFCAACHKQVPAEGEATTAGLAQEQNEYDSWKEGRWYHGDDDPRTIACRECHMPLVDGRDPASGDDVDPYRSPDDGKHRSHRVLASNMYIPAKMQLPGHEEQVGQTIAWLRGEIEVPEIADKWTAGPTVTLEIVAPQRIRAGELVNIGLHLHNNKTGHDFPAGPLDVLESWVELTVEDGRGNTLMELGADPSLNPAIDAPVVYKADWYDRQGLPVERHDLWNVVGASYKRVIRSGGSDIVDVPFRCPGIARPRLSQSASEAGEGERKSDVAFAIADPDFDELRVTARLMFRKANPQFLAEVYEFEPVVQAPVIEIVRATRTIEVVHD